MKKKRIFIIILVLFIVLNIFIPSNFRMILNIPRDMVLSIFNVKKEANIEDYDLVKDENIELKKQIEELQSQLDLNSLLTDKMLINATIISRDIDTWTDSFIIDKGSNSNIKEGMGVVYKSYLIGITYDVGLLTSKVKLLTSSNINKISVKIDTPTKEVYGILCSYNNGLYKIEGITDMDEISINSNVLTTGLSNNIPSGLKIGMVSNIETDNFDLAKIIYAIPGIETNDISYVTVVGKND